MPVGRLVKGGDQADDGRFSRAGRTHQRRYRAGPRFETHVVQHRLAGIVGEVHVLENHRALARRHHLGAPRVLVFGLLVKDFLGAVESGQGFGQLGADRHHLKHRRHQHGQEHGEGHQVAHGHAAGHDLARADVHHGAAHNPHQGVGRKTHQRHGGERTQHVVEQALDPAGKHARLLRLGVVPLHHAHAGQGFGKTPLHFGVDFSAFPKDRPDPFEGYLQDARKERDEEQGEARHQRADAHQDDERNQRFQDSASEFHQSGADQVAHALHVAHDA